MFANHSNSFQFPKWKKLSLSPKRPQDGPSVSIYSALLSLALYSSTKMRVEISTTLERL
jgi:hypothetical protein